MKPANATSSVDATSTAPDDLVGMGFIAGSFGVRGWVRVVASTEYADSLLDYSTWWLGRDGKWTAYTVEDSNVQPKSLNAKLKGVESPEAAMTLKGCTVSVPRSAMPAAEEGEYYWADLIGMDVINRQDENLGRVDSLLQTGANDVLVVKDGATERLLPFVAAVVETVDLATKVIRVDWGLDF